MRHRRDSILCSRLTFGHVVWLEHMRSTDEEEDDEPYKRGQRRRLFVPFPGVRPEGEGHTVRSGIGGGGRPDGPFEVEGAAHWRPRKSWTCVETINIDQSQGAVILSESVRRGKISILRYE